MRGGVKIKKRKNEVDPVYGSNLVGKFINNVMIDGKKTTASRVVYGAFDILKAQGLNPLETFEKVIDIVGPKQEVRARRIGGAAYQVPTEVRGPRRVSLAIRWLLDATRKRANSEFKTFSEKLAAEIQDTLKGEGNALKKRDSVHKMADANKAFAHFKW